MPEAPYAITAEFQHILIGLHAWVRAWMPPREKGGRDVAQALLLQRMVTKQMFQMSSQHGCTRHEEHSKP